MAVNVVVTEGERDQDYHDAVGLVKEKQQVLDINVDGEPTLFAMIPQVAWDALEPSEKEAVLESEKMAVEQVYLLHNPEATEPILKPKETE